jgi:RNA polymerase-binding transcription factor DksA
VHRALTHITRSANSHWLTWINAADLVARDRERSNAAESPMNNIQELVDIQERLYVRRDELARKPMPHLQALHPHGKEVADVESALKQLESGLHPVCGSCGERIEVDRLRVEPFALLCETCVRNQARHPEQ